MTAPDLRWHTAPCGSRTLFLNGRPHAFVRQTGRRWTVFASRPYGETRTDYETEQQAKAEAVRQAREYFKTTSTVHQK